MEKYAAFTICAKNYLAHAFTLKKSFLKNNPDYSFYIFLSDLPENLSGSELEELTLPSTDWIPDWKNMAFKYNVIEYSTSIKPFCFDKLFKHNYARVIYLDPDIYVTSALQSIYNNLNNYSIILSPHYCNIQTIYNGSISEEEILFVGIYNLGFTAIKNDTVGNKIISWWKNRLSEKCYADKFDALHVDQKWMDFIPSFFPNETLITHHMGINPAIWNLHERELTICDDNAFYIRDLQSNELFPLLFFHFSGFDPFNPTIINRRHPKYNTKTYPSFIALFGEYISALYSNNYGHYSKMPYSFNSYEDGEIILPIHRRLFRVLKICEFNSDPFLLSGAFYCLMKKNKLLTRVKSSKFSIYSDKERQRKSFLLSLIIFTLILLKNFLGMKYYSSFLSYINDISRLENQTFLMKEK